MIKVCILTSVHQDFDVRIFHKQAKTLVKAGYDVTLIAPHSKNEIVDGVKIVALPKPKNRFWRMLGTWKVFKLAFKQKADIYHFHDPELLPWGWLLRKTTHRPVIYDVHENYANTILFKAWIPYFLHKPIAQIFDKIEKILAGKVSAIITVTDSMKQRFSGCQAFCISIHNFPSLEIVARTRGNKESDRTDDQYSIIYTGGIGKERGFQTILDAIDLVVRQNSKFTCAIIGEVRNFAWLDEQHSGLMKRVIKEGNLKIIGQVPYNEIFRYLNASVIGWRPEPPYQDAMDIKVFEYMACGNPIVASDFPLVADIIRETKCGIVVDACNAKAHAFAILYLLEHPEEAKKMGEKGRKAVLEKYNWENESEKLLKVYKEILRSENV